MASSSSSRLVTPVSRPSWAMGPLPVSTSAGQGQGVLRGEEGLWVGGWGSGLYSQASGAEVGCTGQACNALVSMPANKGMPRVVRPIMRCCAVAARPPRSALADTGSSPPRREAAQPIMAMRPTNSSLDLVKPRVTLNFWSCSRQGEGGGGEGWVEMNHAQRVAMVWGWWLIGGRLGVLLTSCCRPNNVSFDEV